MGKSAVPSRQLTEALFVLPVNTLLAPAASIVIPAQPSPVPPLPAALGRKVAGYSAVNFLGISDQPFSVLIEEACESDGTYVTVVTLTSVAAGALQRISARHLPSGNFMRITPTNTGGSAQTIFDLCGTGLPVT
jgi:hypothetical protein